MTLAIDVGNSDAVFGLHNMTGWQHIWRTPSRPTQPVATYGGRLRLWFLEAGLSINDVRWISLSSVVPELTPVLRQTVTELFGIEPVVLGPAVYPLLPLDIVRPDQIGTDLVANALAAHTRYGRSVTVVDFGTALTMTTVSASGKILGVSIAPGLKTAIRALFANTAQLPEVPIDLPNSPLGQNTTHAIQAGVVLGYEGMIRFMLQRIRAELGDDHIAVATGGLAGAIPSLHADFVDVVPSLTLDGVRLVGEIVSQQID
jgi:type III pantothenate kinase